MADPASDDAVKYKIMNPVIRYHVLTEVDLPDGVTPQAYQLQPGQKLIDEEGIERATGPSLDASLSTLQDMLADVADGIQDIRDSHEGEN